MSDLLGVLADGGNLAAVPDAARFCAGRKRLLRVVVTHDAGARLKQLAADLAMHTQGRDLAETIGSGTWSRLEGRPLGGESLRRALYLGEDLGLVEAAAEADFTGSEEAGALFGYPPCCIAGLEELERAGSGWPRALVARSGASDVWSAAANRLVVDWGGISPVGELYPCSLACNAAGSIGREGVESLRDLGLARLADRIVADATAACYVDIEGRAKQGVSGVFPVWRLEWK